MRMITLKRLATRSTKGRSAGGACVPRNRPLSLTQGFMMRQKSKYLQQFGLLSPFRISTLGACTTYSALSILLITQTTANFAIMQAIDETSFFPVSMYVGNLKHPS